MNPLNPKKLLLTKWTAVKPVAKHVARAEMNLVLAAAITSLGKESRVMLANLDGVVFDLR